MMRPTTNLQKKPSKISRNLKKIIKLFLLASLVFCIYRLRRRNLRHQ